MQKAGFFDRDMTYEEAERQLEIWMSNHPDDCMVEDKNPLTIRIYPTFFEDPDQKSQRTSFVERRKRRYGR